MYIYAYIYIYIYSSYPCRHTSTASSRDLEALRFNGEPPDQKTHAPVIVVVAIVIVMVVIVIVTVSSK